MTHPTRFACIARSVSAFVALVAFTLLCSALPTHGAETATKNFDLPADAAAKTLRQFSSQSGLDVVFATEAAARVQTNAVKGSFTPREAINRLLAGTGLVAEQNPRTGAITVIRSPNERRVVQSRAGDRSTGASGSSTAITPAPTPAAAAPAAAPGTNANETVLLSPFEVRTDKDTGYIATNTLAGSRLNTRLVDTPASISVMTRDFLTDIGALSVSEAMEYALNASNDIGNGSAQLGASTGNGLIENDFNFQIRGYRRATQTRDYFPTLLDGDAFNIERVEVARGPNSLLFGIGGPGGIVNTTPKRADPARNFGEVAVRIGSWSSRRGSLDVNRTLPSGKLGARVNLMVQRADGFHDFESDDQERGALALTWRPTDSTTIRAGGEMGALHQNRVRPWTAGDNFNKWIANGARMFPFGTPESPAGNLAPNPSSAIDENYSQQFTSAGSGAPANGLPARTDIDGIPGIEQRTAQTGSYNLFMDGPLAGRTLYLGTRAQGARYYRTSTGYGNAAGFNTPFPVTDEGIYPRSGNIAGPGQFVEIDYQTFGITIEQRVGESLFLEGSVNRTRREFLNRSVLGFSNISVQYDATSHLPTFNSNFTYNATPGGPTTTGQGLGALNFAALVSNPLAGGMLITYNPSYYEQENTLDDVRVSASYKLNLGRAGTHTLLAFVSRADTEMDRWSFAIGNVDPARTTANQFTNVPTRVRHIDVFSDTLADRGIPDPWNDPLPITNVIHGAINERFTPGFLPNNRAHSRVRIDSGAVAAHSTFLKGSLITTVGARRDRIKVYNDGPVIRDPVTQVVTGITPATGASVDQSGNTYSVGAVYHLPWIKGVSVFGNKSTNFRDQSGAQAFEDEALRSQREIGPLEGEGRDYGLKFSFLDGRINAVVTRFEVAQTNAATGFDGNVGSYINAIWTTIQNNGPETIQTDAQNPQGHHVGGSDTRGQKSTGWELELTANPTKNWRVAFNLSKSENVVSGLGQNVGAYLEKHRAEWQTSSALNYNTGAAPGFLSNSGGTNNVGALITGLDGILAFIKSGENQTEVNIRPWNANVFTAYRFSEGPLRNFTLGGGVNHRGKAIVGVKAPTSPTAADQSVQIFKGNAYYLVNAMIGYEFKPRRNYTMRAQLNVENVLDNDELQVLASNYGVLQGPIDTGTINKWYYHLEPRRYSLSLTFGF